MASITFGIPTSTSTICAGTRPCSLPSDNPASLDACSRPCPGVNFGTHFNAQRGLITADGGLQQRPAARVLSLRYRENCRQDGGAGVMHRTDVGIVEVAGVGKSAVDEGRAGRVEAITA